MVPALSPVQLQQEVLACAALGAALGAVRMVFPVRGKAAVLPDFLLVGAVLLALQSYAAGWSEAGVLRWYMCAAGAGGAAFAVEAVGVPVRAAERGLLYLLALPGRLLWQRAAAPALRRLSTRRKARKARRNAKRTAKNQKKSLPNKRRMLYNSNVSK